MLINMIGLGGTPVTHDTTSQKQTTLLYNVNHVKETVHYTNYVSELKCTFLSLDQ